MLSRRRMIWLLPYPLPLSREQVVSLSPSSCVSPVELTDGGRGRGAGEEPNHMTARKPGSSINRSTLHTQVSHPGVLKTHPERLERGGLC